MIKRLKIKVIKIIQHRQIIIKKIEKFQTILIILEIRKKNKKKKI